MELLSRLRSGRAKRLAPLAGALLLAALAIPASNPVLAQAPPPEAEIALVNGDEEVVERKEDGRFIARPVFDQELDVLYYGVRHPDTGDWLTSMYRVQGGAKRLADGWEYSWEYPVLDEQPDLDPERAFLLVMLAVVPGGAVPEPFHAVIPVHQDSGLWDRVLGALEPGRWAKAIAGWVIEGVHGALCGVVEQATGVDADNCREG